MSTHSAQTQLQLVGKLILSGDLHCETGLHIGAGKGSLEIGGADNPVVKDAFGLPYIPGSSLRGKFARCSTRVRSNVAGQWSIFQAPGPEVRIHRVIVLTTKSACCSGAIPGGSNAWRGGHRGRAPPHRG
jgi:CRISPR-associated protein Csm3